MYARNWFEKFLKIAVDPAFTQDWQPADWQNFFQSQEQAMLSNPVIKREVDTSGELRPSVTQTTMGVSEGIANFLTREFNKRHKNEQALRAVEQRKKFENRTEDEYLYHVTTQGSLPGIRRRGLVPNSGGGNFAGFYEGHSAGRTFLCERGAISFWKYKVESAVAEKREEVKDRTGKYPPARLSQLVLLRIKRELVSQLQNDKAGTEDSRYGCYFVTQAIPPNVVEVVPG